MFAKKRNGTKATFPMPFIFRRGTIEFEIEEKVPDLNTTVICIAGAAVAPRSQRNLQKMGYKNVRSLSGSEPGRFRPSEEL